MNVLQVFIAVGTIVGFLAVGVMGGVCAWIAIDQAITRRRNNRKWREITEARAHHAADDAAPSYRKEAA